MSIVRASKNIMRAIRVSAFGGIENLKLDTNTTTPSPGENEVLIKVSAAGINPVDTYIRAGTYARPPPLPYTPGSDAAGVVEAIGSKVTDFKKGDRVFTVKTTTGAYAEYTTAETTFVGHLDEKLTFAQGASIGIPYFTALKALHLRAQAKSGETVLIHGASGAVGIAAIQVSRSMGLGIIGTAGTQEGMDLVKANGADLVFNHRQEGYVKAIQDAIGGADLIVEMLANVNLQTDLELLNYRGRVAVIGVRGTIEINPRNVLAKESSIMGVNVMSTTEPEWRQMQSLISTGQTEGWLKPCVATTLPLGEAGKAHNDVMNKQGAGGKIILDTTQ